jgi:hypothetical protein
MTDQSDIDTGLWIAWKLKLPLRVNAQLITVDDDIGQAAEARHAPAGSDEPDALDSMDRLRLVQHMAFAMAKAAHALGEIGAKTGLLTPRLRKPGTAPPRRDCRQTTTHYGDNGSSSDTDEP